MKQYTFNKKTQKWHVEKVKYDGSTARELIEYFLHVVADRPFSEDIIKVKASFAQMLTTSLAGRTLETKYGIPDTLNGVATSAPLGVSATPHCAECLLCLMVDDIGVAGKSEEAKWADLRLYAYAFTTQNLICDSGAYYQVFSELTEKEFIFELLKLAISMKNNDGIDTSVFMNYVADRIDSLK